MTQIHAPLNGFGRLDAWTHQTNQTHQNEWINQEALQCLLAVVDTRDRLACGMMANVLPDVFDKGKNHVEWESQGR